MKTAILRLLGGENVELSPPPAYLFPDIKTPVGTWGDKIDLLEFNTPEDLGGIDWENVDWSMIGDQSKPDLRKTEDPAVRIKIIESWNRHLDPAEPTEDLRRLTLTSEDLSYLKFENMGASVIDDVKAWFADRLLNNTAANRRAELNNADMQGW